MERPARETSHICGQCKYFTPCGGRLAVPFEQYIGNGVCINPELKSRVGFLNTYSHFTPLEALWAGARIERAEKIEQGETSCFIPKSR